MKINKTALFLFSLFVLIEFGFNASAQGVSKSPRDYQAALDVNHWGPDWSPDGNYLAFAGRNEADEEYYVLELNLETGDIAPLVKTGTFEVRPRYSPDGSKILYLSTLFTGTQDAAIYDRETGQAARVNIPGSEPLVINRPVWNPEGTGFYFDTIAGDTGRDIYFYDLDTGEVKTLVQGPGNESYSYPSPDDKSLVYRDDFDGDPDLFIYDLETGEARKLTDNDFVDQGAVWSPDGKWLAYFADPTGDNEIYLLDPESGERVRLTYSPDWDFMPAFSPDGTKIAFDSRRTGIRGIYVMDLDGENVLPLSRPENSTLIEDIRERGVFEALGAYEAALGSEAYSEPPFLAPEIADLIQKALDSNSFTEALALADAWMQADSWSMARDTWTQGPLGEVLPHMALRKSLTPTGRNWTMYGIALAKLGRFEEAKTAFDAALALNPDEPLAIRGLKELKGVLS